MTIDQKKMANVKTLINDCLFGIKEYLSNWHNDPKSFTTVSELNLFDKKLQEMKNSLEGGTSSETLGLWRIMETWPYHNELRKKIVDAEYNFERLKISADKIKHHDFNMHNRVIF